ncbi:hypothetical protein [Candidatus Palauibacter sp.]|uniref:hypothetical protein n=1 Tax=Candidatus Palauibacter sp. TaxID=3101350 RepID=UPI003B028DB0
MTLATMLFTLLLRVHVAAGFVGLAAFWVPVFARKGGRTHVRAGRVYAWCAYVVTLSAVILAVGRIGSHLGEGIGVAERPDLYGFPLFLGYLGVTTFAAVRQALRAVATRRTPETLRTTFHEVLAWASIAGSVTVIAFALGLWSSVSPILLGLSPIGFLTGSRMLRLMRNPGLERMGWFYSHMASMLTGGIAFHTAFAVVGAPRLWEYDVAGPFALLPWLLPTAIGVPAIVIWTRRYRRKFNRAARRASPG